MIVIAMHVTCQNQELSKFLFPCCKQGSSSGRLSPERDRSLTS